MRVNLIICCHGDLALGFLSATKMICGANNMSALPFREGDNLYNYSDKVKEIVTKTEARGEKSIIITDIYGGTPYNAAVLALASIDFKGYFLVGANLGMILELATVQNYEDINIKDILSSSQKSVSLVNVSEYTK